MEESVLRILFQLAEDRDVACVPDLFGEVRGVEDEFRLEEGVLLGLRQERKIDPHVEVLERSVDESGMTPFVAAHEAEELGDIRVRHAPPDLRVQDAAGKLRGQRADEKVDELLDVREVRPVPLEGLGPTKVIAVGIGAKLLQERVVLLAHRAHVDVVELLEVGRVEARRQDGVFLGLACRFVDGSGRSAPRSLRRTAHRTRNAPPAWSTNGGVGLPASRQLRIPSRESRRTRARPDR